MSYTLKFHLEQESALFDGSFHFNPIKNEGYV
jgi:hypothetical protein